MKNHTQCSRPAPKGQKTRGQRGSAALKAILWALVGALVAFFLVADPLGVSPVDGWLGISRTMEVEHGGGDGHGDGLWTCGMHPEVIQEEPGICPICQMDLVPLRADDSGSADDGHYGHADESGLWTCPMHPDVLEEEPGSCPICGMDLVPVKSDTAPEQGDREILFYRNPMDPSIISQVPRKDEMGMDYVPVYADEAESAAAQGAVVTIDPTVVQNMNVVTEAIERKDIRRQIRTVGYLGYDQERMVSVTTKFSGFIEKTYINYIGQPVTRGEPLFEIYAPELVQTEQELLSAMSYVRSLSDAPAEAKARAEALLEAATQRLTFWDITPEQIRRLEETGEVVRTLKIVAPASGVVMKRMPGLEGMAAKPGMELLHIADLSNLWLTVEVFDEQLPWLDIGSPATVTLSYFPGVTYRGRVRYIEPEVSEKTRTIQLTLDVPNRDRRLRVGMYATVVFNPQVAEDAITVPAQAVIRTGKRDVVVVALGDGRFAPREVQLGSRGDGFIQVLEGLAEGEEIVTSAQFLIDSESNLREAIQKMIAAKRAGGAS
ncbi:MAG: efflux RND transporter periplasmic adaptor subunit [Acidobacteriota bacterium]|jgi:RND family efflux transporter MFP subunit